MQLDGNLSMFVTHGADVSHDSGTVAFRAFLRKVSSDWDGRGVGVIFHALTLSGQACGIY